MLHVRFLSQSFDYMCTGPSPAFHICSGVPAWVMVFYSKDFIDQAVSPALSQYLSCRASSPWFQCGCPPLCLRHFSPVSLVFC